jgi:hypothetical protein
MTPYLTFLFSGRRLRRMHTTATNNALNNDAKEKVEYNDTKGAARLPATNEMTSPA